MNLNDTAKYKKIWITWENQRRNITLSRELGARLFQFDLQVNPFARYLISIFKTFSILIKERPSLIFVQNPSLVLSFLATSYGRVFNIPIVVDTHNAGIFPLKGYKWWTHKVVLYILKKSSITIVTNENLKNYVELNGGRAFVLPDPIPDFSCKIDKVALKGKYNVLFICTFAMDEPYMEVVKAARMLNEDIYVYITGNFREKEDELRTLMPENVVLTGYIPEEEYLRILFSVDVIIDLTTRENCLVCGAYEAVAAEKPLIVSGTQVLKDYFYKGVLYTNNTHQDLSKNIEYAIVMKERLVDEIIELKKELIVDWNKQKIALDALLAEHKNSKLSN